MCSGSEAGSHLRLIDFGVTCRDGGLDTEEGGREEVQEHRHLRLLRVSPRLRP